MTLVEFIKLELKTIIDTASLASPDEVREHLEELLGSIEDKEPKIKIELLPKAPKHLLQSKPHIFITDKDGGIKIRRG